MKNLRSVVAIIAGGLLASLLASDANAQYATMTLITPPPNTQFTLPPNPDDSVTGASVSGKITNNAFANTTIAYVSGRVLVP